MTAVAPSLRPRSTCHRPAPRAAMPAPVVRPAHRARAHARPIVATRRPSAAVFWRRRLALAAATLVVLVVLVTLASTAAARFGGGPDGPARPLRVTHYTVQPGDTLWRIATRLEPHRDPREVVDALIDARHTTVVSPGEVIDWAGL